MSSRSSRAGSTAPKFKAPAFDSASTRSHSRSGQSLRSEPISPRSHPRSFGDGLFPPEDDARSVSSRGSAAAAGGSSFQPTGFPPVFMDPNGDDCASVRSGSSRPNSGFVDPTAGFPDCRHQPPPPAGGSKPKPKQEIKRNAKGQLEVRVHKSSSGRKPAASPPSSGSNKRAPSKLDEYIWKSMQR